MVRLKLGVAVEGLTLPLREIIDLGRKLSVSGLQFDARSQLPPDSLTETGRRQFLQELKACSLQVAALSFNTRRPFFELEGLDTRLDLTRQAMQFAFQLGSRNLSVRFGKIPAERESKDYELLRTVLNDLARYGNHIGVILAILPTGEEPDRLAELLSEIDQGPIGVNFDPLNFAFNGHKPATAIRTLHRWIVQYRLRDGQKDYDGQGIEVPMGRGELDWNEIFALIHETEFQGWLIVDRTQGEDRLGDLSRAVQFAKTMIWEDA
ncbi:MAG: sugar phosphate isomerase/epimerase family protein [Planctomycetaceae bacterium]